MGWLLWGSVQLVRKESCEETIWIRRIRGVDFLFVTKDTE